MDDSIRPGDDFQQAVNRRWLRTTPIPSTKVIYSTTDEIEDRLNERLLHILSKASKVSAKGEVPRSREGILQDAFGRLTLSSMRVEKQKFSIQYLQQNLRKLGCMRNVEDLAMTLGSMARQNIPSLFHVNSIVDHQEDRDNRLVQKMIIEPGGLGLPDSRWQKGEGPGKTRILQKQVELLKDLSQKLDTQDLTQAIQVEAELSIPFETSKREPTREYSLAHLETAHPGFPWGPFFEGLGLSIPPSRSINVLLQSDAWIRHVIHHLKNRPIHDWIPLISLHMILHALPQLPPPQDDLHFRFFGKDMRGQVKKVPQKDLTLDFCKRIMTPQLGELYRKEQLSPSTKQSHEAFVRTILSAAKDRLAQVSWLSKPSIRRSIEKVDSMELCISSPKDFSETPPPLRSDNFLQNLYQLESQHTKARLSRLGTLANPSAIWDEGIQQANAQYQTESNQLVIPAGMFEFPFQNTKQSLGWNQGGLGAAIGHEITHAFDEEGRQFDEKGFQKPWWSASDLRHQKQKTKALIQLQEESSFHGQKVNGTSTLSENLADLGGLTIALHALRHAMDQEKCSEEEVKRHLHDFFVSQAVSWRTKVRPKQAIQSLFLDHHAPAEWRVNQVVRHIDEWQEAFGVTTPDALQLPPEERIRIF